MKTPIQELIEKIEHAISYNVEGGLVAKYTWEELLQDSYYLLEKEKEHIIEAYLEGADYTNDDHVTLAKKYYNQKYQNKQHENTITGITRLGKHRTKT